MVRLEGHIVHRVEFDTHKEATREAIDRVKTASINGDDAIKIKVEANAKDIVTLATKVKTWGAAVAILISLISIASRFI
jgi:hypothetical protein